MRCQEVRPLLYTYIDGYLANQVERSLFGHLSQCEYCQQDLAYARQTHALLEKYCVPVEPPVGFAEGVLAALEGTGGEQAAPTAAAVRKKPVKSWRSLGRVAQVASFVLLSAAVWFSSQFSGGFQLARTPEPHLDPGTGYKVVKDREDEIVAELPSAPRSEQEQDQLPPADDGWAAGVSRPALEDEKPDEREGKGTAVTEPVGEGAEPNPQAEAEAEKPPATEQAPPEFSVPGSLPRPVIAEPGGEFKAAGVSGGDAWQSASLQRVSAETKQQLAEVTGKPAAAIDAEAGPIWSPDRQAIAYGKDGYLYIAEPDGSEAQAITTLDGALQGIAWSAQGQLAVNVRGNAKQQGLWVGSPVGNGWQKVAEIGGGKEIIWSPDGQKLAFTDGEGMAYFLTFKQTGQRDRLYPLTPEKGVNGAAGLTWSANSQSVYFKWAPTGEAVDLWQGILP